MSELITTATTVIGSFIAIGGFIVGILQYRKKIQLSTFRLYADRYNQIITHDVLDEWHNALKEKENNPYWEKLTPTMVAYLNLIWEESYLAKNGIISKKLWQIWEKEAVKVVNSEFAQHVMKKYDYQFPDKLTTYMIESDKNK